MTTQPKQNSGPYIVTNLDDYATARDHLNRIVTTLESDADLDSLPAVRGRLLHEAYAALRCLRLPAEG